MALFNYSNIFVKSICSSVPKNKVFNQKLKNLINKTNLEKIIFQTGISERRVIKKNQTITDLFLECAKKLIKDLKNRDEIDVLICVTQTPDYKQPSASQILHDLLKLDKKVSCFDINLACSGFVYGLNVACSMLKNKEIKNVLLLVGDTATKYIGKNDLDTIPLFGDGASGLLLQKTNKKNNFYFNCMTDGKGHQHLFIEGGGYKYPNSKNFNLSMNGLEVFKFSISDVPENINDLIKKFNLNTSKIDYLILHQSNKQIMQHIGSKTNFNQNKILFSLKNYGNTGSASIPITICHNRILFKNKSKKILMSGYGGGLSWGSGVIEIDNKTKVHEIINV